MKKEDFVNTIFDCKKFKKCFYELSLNNLKNITLNFLKIVLLILFLPILFLFTALENKIFLRIFKQIMFFLYLILLVIFIYTIATFKKHIDFEHKEVIIDVPFTNKIKDF